MGTKKLNDVTLQVCKTCKGTGYEEGQYIFRKQDGFERVTDEVACGSCHGKGTSGVEEK